MDYEKTLAGLCALPGPSGFEGQAARAALELLRPLVDEAFLDRMGSVVGVRRCGREGAKKVLQVSGDSMNPTLEDRDILLLVKSDSMKTGDLCGFYWQNKLLLKRVIGQPGDVISMDEDGHVTVNGTVLDEPYVDELALGECDIRFPYQVPENRYFVLGDHRSVSIDSRSSVIGCVEKSQVVGRVFLRIWPLNRFAVF